MAVPCAPIFGRTQSAGTWNRENYIPKHLFIINDTNTPRKRCDHGFEEIKNLLPTYFCRVHLHVCAHSSVFGLLRSNREIREWRCSSVGYKRENAHLAVRYYDNYSCPSRQVMHNNFEVVRGLRSNYKYIHCCTHYVHSVQSVTPRVKIMILTSVICWLFSDFYWVDLCTHTARPCL